jgi:hypothetical protein
MRAVLRVACIALAAYGAVPAALADDSDPEVDLQLVLAVDISRSMDLGELQVQRDGYVAAFRHPEVIDAIASGPNGRIAVAYVEWSGAFFNTVITPWRIIGNRAQAEAFAAELEDEPITQGRGTSISGGLAFAANYFTISPVTGRRRAIDISGDGPNNIGAPVEPTRDGIVAQGITINGLPLLIRPSLTDDAFGVRALDVYYQDCVIGGPGAFMIPVERIDDFAGAIRRKLILEIAALPGAPVVVPVAETQPAPLPPRTDCTVGEASRSRAFGR